MKKKLMLLLIKKCEFGVRGDEVGKLGLKREGGKEGEEGRSKGGFTGKLQKATAHVQFGF